MKYRVEFITSSDSSSYIDVTANSPIRAREIAKRYLGRECYRIISVYRID